MDYMSSENLTQSFFNLASLLAHKRQFKTKERIPRTRADIEGVQRRSRVSDVQLL